MADTVARIKVLAATGDVLVTRHAHTELANDGIITDDVIRGAPDGVVVEDYPLHDRGPCALMLQSDARGPIHVVWGLRRGTDRPAVIITAYRPDPHQWVDDFTRRAT
ncbi:MAG TPA: DUF4258 domain-containing protein [Tepidisphaeraceae bacterium]|nr:DUF4258 domain-containing protein [Tepidisphaeraceae bacterium]